MEPQEIREEVKEKLEHAAEDWVNFLALTTVILAVCATLSSFQLEHYSVESVLKQALASDQWAFYQAKSVKGYLYDLQREKLELELSTVEKNLTPELKERYQKTITSYGTQVETYNKEKKEIMHEAKEFEKGKDEAQERRETFGHSIIFLQMGILLCSMAALMRKKYIWIVGSLVGAVGIVYFANGYLHFM
ncbi:MAG: DUF4337 domain-containing protein [Desulfomonilaceae bacterium]